MSSDKLRAVRISFDGEPLYQPLVTTREFGRWVSERFQHHPKVIRAACHISNAEGRTYHPGAPISGYFKKYPVINKENRQVSFVVGTEVADYLIKNGYSQLADANKWAGSDNGKYDVIKLYSLKQIVLFMRYILSDNKFDIAGDGIEVADIRCTRKPTFLFDQTSDGAIGDRRSLFDGFRPPAKTSDSHSGERNFYQLKDSCGIKFHANGSEIINLYKMNFRKMGWEYLDVTVVPDDGKTGGMIYVEQGSKEWHNAKVWQNGTMFSCGGTWLSDRFPELIPGRYAMDWIPEQGRFIIYLKWWQGELPGSRRK